MAKLFKHNVLTATNINCFDGYARYVSRDRCSYMVDIQRCKRLSPKRRAQVTARMCRGL